MYQPLMLKAITSVYNVSDACIFDQPYVLCLMIGHALCPSLVM